MPQIKRMFEVHGFPKLSIKIPANDATMLRKRTCVQMILVINVNVIISISTGMQSLPVIITQFVREINDVPNSFW